MKTKIARWGNSLAIRLPKDAVASLGLRNGTPVELRAQDGELVLTPQRVQDPELEKLIGAITAKNRHTETDWGSAVGGEAW
jgi:antitoxin MazE